MVSAEAIEEKLAAEGDGTMHKNHEHKSMAVQKECGQVEFDGIPLEGRVKSEIECQTCGFKSKATLSTFVVLTLPVPQKVCQPISWFPVGLLTQSLQSHTSLSECIDGALSTEYIDDFQCAKCRLEHAVIIFSNRLRAASSPADAQFLEESISKLQAAIETDPEEPPEGIELPPSSDAPRSRIAKCTMIHDYPDIIALHLSRSIFDAYASRKNSAKVSFPEHLQMGGILNRRGYRLLCVVTHKGQHDSGHYECFRRQVVARPPYSTPTPSPSVPVTPTLTPAPSTPIPSTPSNRSSPRLVDGSPSEASPSPTTSVSQAEAVPPPSSKRSSSSVSSNTDTELPASVKSPSLKTKKLKSPKKRQGERWWRISDDKIKEARTNDVLDQRKEVYLLFYQKEKV
jgi:ubiquitin carboxyl-terminal hydrolase 16